MESPLLPAHTSAALSPGVTSLAATSACVLPFGLPRTGATLLRALRRCAGAAQPGDLALGRALTASAVTATSAKPAAAAAEAALGAARVRGVPASARPPCWSPPDAAPAAFRGVSRGAGMQLPLPLRGPRLRQMATQASGGAASPASAAGASARRGGGPASVAPGGLRGRLGDAVRLQLAAAWQSYGRIAYGLAAVTAVYVTWRVMRTTTNMFIAVNDKMAEYGIMATAVCSVVLAALYLRWRAAVNPAAVYRQAMMQLNTHPGVLEVLGAPLAGSPVRAYVVTGGGLYLSKRFRLKLRNRRIQMLFPLSGSERKGLVSLEAKRKAGQYAWRLLAVDLGPELQTALPAGGAPALSAAPPANEPGLLPQQPRLYVVGDAAAYQRSGVLADLRSPFLKALSNSRSYEVEDELEDELDELRVPGPSPTAAAAQSAVRKARGVLASALARAKKAPAAEAEPTAPGFGTQGSRPSGAAAATAAAAAPLAPPKPAATVPSPVPPAPQSAPGVSASPPPPAPPGMAAKVQSSRNGSSGGSWWDRAKALLGGPAPVLPPPEGQK